VSEASRRWVKVWHEILTDQNFQNMSLDQQARFYNLLVYTSAHGDSGTIKIVAPGRVFIHLLQCENYDHLVQCITEIPNIGIVKNDNAELSVTFSNWYKYQVDSTSYDRVKKHRNKRNVTPQEKEEEKEKDKSSGHTEFIKYAYQTFTEKYGEKLCVDGGKDGAIVKKLLGTYGLEKLKGLWDVFMQSTDPFIEQAGRSISVFKSQVNKLTAAKARQSAKRQVVL